MASLIESLTETLRKETSEYKQLLQLTQEKTNAIVKNEIEQVKSITELEEKNIKRISKLELERQGAIKEIASVLQVDVKALKVSDIIGILGKSPKEQEALKVIQAEFVEVLSQLQKANENNKELIEQALQYIDFSINVLQTSRNTVTGGYNAGGMSQYGGPASDSFFDLKR